MKTKSLGVSCCILLFLCAGNCRSQIEDSVSTKQHVIGDILLQLSNKQFIAPLLSIEYGSPIGVSFSSRYMLAVSEVQEYGFVHYMSLILNPGLKGCRLAIGYWLIAIGHSIISLEGRLAAIHTFSNPIHADPHSTYLGPELRIGAGGLFNLGYYYQVDKATSKKRTFVGIQYGIGF